MPKKKSRKTRRTRPGPEPPEAEILEERAVAIEEDDAALSPEELALERFEAAVGEIPEDQLQVLRIYAWRLTPKTSEGVETAGYLGALDCPADPYAICEELRERFGGVRFRVQLRGTGAQPSLSHVFQVAGAPKLGVRKDEETKGIKLAPEVLQVLTDLDGRLGAVEKALVTRPRQEDDIERTLKLMEKLQGLVQRPAAAAAPPQTLAQALRDHKQVQELAEEIVGEEEGEEGEEGGEEEKEEKGSLDEIDELRAFLKEDLPEIIETGKDIVQAFKRAVSPETRARIEQYMQQLSYAWSVGADAVRVAQQVAPKAGEAIVDQMRQAGAEGLAGLVQAAGLEVEEGFRSWLHRFVEAL